MDSTAAGSLGYSSKSKNSKPSIASVKSNRKEFTIDLREFTLGNRQKDSSTRAKIKDRAFEPQISEFSLDAYEPLTRVKRDQNGQRLVPFNE
jgi:hypothetical protein